MTFWTFEKFWFVFLESETGAEDEFFDGRENGVESFEDFLAGDWWAGAENGAENGKELTWVYVGAEEWRTLLNGAEGRNWAENGAKNDLRSGWVHWLEEWRILPGVGSAWDDNFEFSRGDFKGNENFDFGESREEDGCDFCLE